MERGRGGEGREGGEEMKREERGGRGRRGEEEEGGEERKK